MAIGGWVFISIKRRKTAAAARCFFKEVAKAAPFVISTFLTDNGKEFTDKLFGSLAKDVSGEHEFDLLCDSLGIEHRLTKPGTPQTNDMVERFNRRLEQVDRRQRLLWRQWRADAAPDQPTADPPTRVSLVSPLTL